MTLIQIIILLSIYAVLGYITYKVTHGLFAYNNTELVYCVFWPVTVINCSIILIYFLSYKIGYQVMKQINKIKKNRR